MLISLSQVLATCSPGTYPRRPRNARSAPCSPHAPQPVERPQLRRWPQLRTYPRHMGSPLTQGVVEDHKVAGAYKAAGVAATQWSSQHMTSFEQEGGEPPECKRASRGRRHIRSLIAKALDLSAWHKRRLPPKEKSPGGGSPAAGRRRPRRRPRRRRRTSGRRGRRRRSVHEGAAPDPPQQLLRARAGRHPEERERPVRERPGEGSGKPRRASSSRGQGERQNKLDAVARPRVGWGAQGGRGALPHAPHPMRGVARPPLVGLGASGDWRKSRCTQVRARTTDSHGVDREIQKSPRALERPASQARICPGQCLDMPVRAPANTPGRGPKSTGRRWRAKCFAEHVR